MSDAPEVTAKAAEAGGSVSPAASEAAGYRVLARKYRPSTFAELVGQDAMVRTLTNAFNSGRIAQAYILTGVRGVGKTTTARILARALNYEPPEGGGAPTLDMPGFGKHCQAIMESRHIDVIEMDAASHNSVDDIRQINDAVRYTPVSARYKVYILDEVHMLSGAAFNALLKTLEEPPPHVKFIFATTEIRKVPVTVLSRCQRFDLRRVEADVIARQLADICAKEDVKAEPEALGIIARAAEGSVRDALSLLDQAIAHGAGTLEAVPLREQLGLADRTRVIDLFEALMRGDIATALSDFRELYDTGADPAVIVADLAEFTHLVTRFKLVPSTADDRSLIESERTRGSDFAQRLSIRLLSRAWQMLLKGHAEVQAAEKPVQAAEMLLVRLAFAADLPTPDEALRALREGENSGDAPSIAGMQPAGPGVRLALAADGGSRANAAPRSDPAPQAAAPHASPRLASLADIAALAAVKRDLPIKLAIERYVRPVSIQEGKLEIAVDDGAPANLVRDLSARLLEWTGNRWLVVLTSGQGGATLAETAAAQHDALQRDVHADPLVEAVLARFPGAEIVDVRRRGEAGADQLPVPDVAEFDMPPDPPDEDPRD